MVFIDKYVICLVSDAVSLEPNLYARQNYLFALIPPTRPVPNPSRHTSWSLLVVLLFVIEAIFNNVFVYSLCQKIAEWSSLGNAIADIARSDVEQRRLQEADFEHKPGRLFSRAFRSTASPGGASRRSGGRRIKIGRAVPGWQVT